MLATFACRQSRMGDAATPILSQLPPRPPQPAGWNVPEDFHHLTEIFAPPAQWLEASKAASLHPQGPSLAGAWLSPGTPPYLPSLGVIATPADVRSIPWFAMKYGCTGLFLGEVLNWSGDPFATAAGAETRLFYPGCSVGVDMVLPSVRLKRLRRGLQDLAYLWLLRQRERPAVATAIMNSLVRYGGLEAAGDNYLDPRLGGWVHDGAAYEAAPPADGGGDPGAGPSLGDVQPGSAGAAGDVAAVRAKHAHGADRAGAISRAAAFGPGGQAFPRRGHDRPVQRARARRGRAGEVRGHAGGLAGQGGAASLGPMPAGTRQTIELSAEGDYLPTGADAKMVLPLSITEDLQTRRSFRAVVPFIVAAPVDTHR